MTYEAVVVVLSPAHASQKVSVMPQPHRDDDRLVLEPREVAQRLGCTADHVRTLIRTGKLQGFRLGRRWYVPLEVIDALLVKGKVSA